MKSTVTIQANKSSSFIIIPKKLLEKLEFKKGDTVLLEITEDKELKITK